MALPTPSAGGVRQVVGAFLVVGGVLGLAESRLLVSSSSPPPPVSAAAAADRAAPTEPVPPSPETAERTPSPQPGATPAPGHTPAVAPTPVVGDEGAWGRAVPLGQADESVPVAPPVAVSIPAIAAASDLVGLDVLADGTLEVPDTAEQAGWFAAGVRPGEPGPAIIAGHVDLGGSPGVFHRLDQLLPGDEVEVRDADGGLRVFVVDGVERYAKEAFPTEAVYGPQPGPVLRLITCGGMFDPGTGHYRDNVIVTARLR